MIERHLRVKDIEIFQETINFLNENKDDLFQRIQEDLFSKKEILEVTLREEAISNDMFMAAQAVEAEKLAELSFEEAEMDVAVASENPIAIECAVVRLESAQSEYESALEHRKRVEYRCELAKQCVAIAEAMYSEVEMSYTQVKETIQRVSTIGLTRLFSAKNDLENYLGKTSQTLNSMAGTSLKSSLKINVNQNSANNTTVTIPELAVSQKKLIKKETGWDDEIIDRIKTMAQYEIYKKANLSQKEVNGRKCLVKKINLDFEDPKSGMTNRELMAMGRSPYDDQTGERIELHHMNQEFDGPFVELAENTEHGDGNQTILHLKDSESWRNDPKKKNQYKNRDRPEHWQKRLEDLEKNG